MDQADGQTGDGQERARVGAPTLIVAILGIVCVVGGLMALRLALPAYEYWAGAPTTAMIVDCASHSGGTCDGMWSVAAVPQTGPIDGLYDSRDRRVGSQVNVHVHGDTAYTASFASLMYKGVSAGLLALATGVVLVWSARRRFTTGRWPWSGRRSSV